MLCYVMLCYVMLCYKIAIEQIPPNMCKIIKPVTHHNERYLRSKNKNLLEVPKYRLNASQRSYNYRGPVYWNKLEENIKSSESLALFKSSLYTSNTL